MRGNPGRGAQYVVKGLGLVMKPGLRRYVFMPLLINIVIFSLGFYYAFSFFGGWLTGMLASIPSWLQFVEWLAWPTFFIMFLLISGYTFSIVANVVAAPFNGMLAEQVEIRLVGEGAVPESTWSDLLKQLPAIFGRELAKLWYYLPRAIFLLLLSLIPGLNILSILFAAWMMFVQYIDYPMDNHRIKFRPMLKKIKQRRFLGLGFGGLVMVLSMIPILNLFIMPVAVAGATALWVDEFRQDHINSRHAI